MGKQSVTRAKKEIEETCSLCYAANLSMRNSQRRASFVMETYLRSQYGYNAFLIDEVAELEGWDVEVWKRMGRGLLQSREGEITNKAVRRLQSLPHIPCFHLYRMTEPSGIVSRTRQIADQGPQNRYGEG